MLEVTGIEKTYKKRQILRGVTFTAGAGQCVGIAGGNGCGKTTLLSILAGVNRPDRGSVRFDGAEAVGKRREFEKNAAYVPQENPLIPELTARDNLLLWFKGDKRRMEEDLCTGVGAALDLTAFLDIPAGKLSGGQKKRLSIASALSNKAPVLILDEPGAALDLAAKEEILRYVKTYLSDGGCVILTSHEMAELALCTKLYILKDGRLNPAQPGLTAEELTRLF